MLPINFHSTVDCKNPRDTYSSFRYPSLCHFIHRIHHRAQEHGPFIVAKDHRQGVDQIQRIAEWTIGGVDQRTRTSPTITDAHNATNRSARIILDVDRSYLPLITYYSTRLDLIR